MRTITILLLGLLLAAWALPAAADDTDPQGVRLKGAVEHYMQTAPKDDATAKAIRAKGGADAVEDSATNDAFRLLCMAEMGTVVGMFVWQARLGAEACTRLRGMGAMDYCMAYSRNCDHWTWSAECMQGKGCPRQ